MKHIHSEAAIRFLPAVVLTVVGCSDVPTIVLNSQSTATLGSSPTEVLDDKFDRIGRDISGFAGIYVDSANNLVIALTDRGQSEKARGYIAGERDRLDLPATNSTVIRVVRYDFPTLRSWQKRIEPQLLKLGVHTWDVDERNNQLWFATSDEEGRSRVLQTSAALGIPEDAIHVTVSPAPTFRAELDAYTRPIVGGLQIWTEAPVSLPICTAGFTAQQNSTWYMVTASHCSKTFLATDNSTVWQPKDTSFAFSFGWEAKDRLCWIAVLCRYSDATMYQYVSQSEGEGQWLRGRLIRTMSSSSSLPGGSTTINPDDPYFEVTSKATSTPPVGTVIQKIGRTTGWTHGTITQTCVSTNINGRLMGCMVVANLISNSGDSGAPIFMLTGVTPQSGGRETVKLIGVLSGGPPNDLHTTYFSSYAGIEVDLGAMTVCSSATYGC